eukprot:TRINITY_DN67056_c5_g9_i1.p1 TRINITY_DN67056_c5_g9~~TRINITY_DN67056_c5_g9_i1.p1  ORF type:complete len:369 (-),score=53.06 TRINITY_DN67056_c5_g9_i1:746-1765(-)
MGPTQWSCFQPPPPQQVQNELHTREELSDANAFNSTETHQFRQRQQSPSPQSLMHHMGVLSSQYVYSQSQKQPHTKPLIPNGPAGTCPMNQPEPESSPRPTTPIVRNVGHAGRFAETRATMMEQSAASYVPPTNSSVAHEEGLLTGGTHNTSRSSHSSPRTLDSVTPSSSSSCSSSSVVLSKEQATHTTINNNNNNHTTHLHSTHTTKSTNNRTQVDASNLSISSLSMADIYTHMPGVAALSQSSPFYLLSSPPKIIHNATFNLNQPTQHETTRQQVDKRRSATNIRKGIANAGVGGTVRRQTTHDDAGAEYKHVAALQKQLAEWQRQDKAAGRTSNWF